nr:MAG TPA: hypothetical protein [Caudoviricetes sp.]
MTCPQSPNTIKVQVMQVIYCNTRIEIFKNFFLHKVMYTTCATCTTILMGGLACVNVR